MSPFHTTTNPSQQSGEAPEYLLKASLGLALATAVVLTPFVINHFLRGRILLGAGTLTIVAIMAFNGWSIARRNRYSSTLTLFVLAPVILLFLAVSMHEQGVVGVLWCYPAVVSFYIMLPERKAWMANIALVAVVVPEAWTLLDHSLAIRMTATLVAVSVFAAIFLRVISNQHARLRLQATTDPLTGVLNRALLDVFLEQASRLHARTGAPATLIALDLDHFKAINDTLGHDAGDRALRAFADLVRKRCRATDKVFRMGGEEFLLLLHGTEGGNALQVAEELRGAVASGRLIAERAVTVSAGVATLRPGEDWRAWMKRADENLYHAKMNGRNQVVAHGI